MKHTMKRALFLSVLAGALVFTLGGQNAMASNEGKVVKPPKGFVEVSKALKVPQMAFIPGLGTLWVDPATLPAGPFLDYDKKGRLLGATYMIPLKSLHARKDFDNLGKAIAGMKVDHTDIEFSDPHPGVMEPHVHVTNWFVSRAEQVKALGTYHGQHEH